MYSWMLINAALFFLISGCKTPEKQVNELNNEGSTSQVESMEYVNICDQQKICRKFSRLIMGTDHLAQGDWIKNGQPEMNEQEINAVLDEAVKLGINFIDTAPIYVGGIENKVGKWLNLRRQEITSDSFYTEKSLNPDRKVYLLSKGGFPFDLFYSKKLESGTHSKELKNTLRRQGVIPSGSLASADGSIELKDVPPGTYASRLFGSESQMTSRVGEELGHTKANLNNDLVVYLMHRDDGDYFKFNEVARSQTPVKSIMKALSHSDISGKYSLLGWSNWQTTRVDESIELAAKDSNLLKPTFNSSCFSLFEMSSRTIHAGGVQVTHQEMMDLNFQKGIFQNPYSPLGGFSILDKPEPKWENAKKSAKEKYDAGDAYWQNVYHSVFTAENEKRYKRVDEFTKAFNLKHHSNYTIDQMINAYALAHKRTDFLTIGPVNVEQLRRTVASLKLSKLLTVKEVEYLYSGN